MTDPANEADAAWSAITDTEGLGRGMFSSQQASKPDYHVKMVFLPRCFGNETGIDKYRWTGFPWLR